MEDKEITKKEVDNTKENPDKTGGAGDQGIMVGYACKDTDNARHYMENTHQMGKPK